MPAWQSSIGLISLLLVPAAAYGQSWDTCQAEPSEGPAGATIEIRIGNLPALEYVSWWAARKSTEPYSPLENPGLAQVFSSASQAYASNGDSDYNGGKVLVNAEGEATLRVHAPATYKRCWGGGPRDPHIHFMVCGGSGRPQKLEFKSSGLRIKGGCGSRGDAVSYTLLSAHDDIHEEEFTTAAPEEEKVAAVPEDPKDKNKDWDAIEFSPIYKCLEEAKLFDQFSSECSAQCPVHADVAHAQCVRKEVDAEKQVLTASWRLQLDCNDKCWADAMPTSRHMVRLALADHLDIAFQEAQVVQIRKDLTAPNSHAHLKVEVHTKRLDSGLGSSLLGSFLDSRFKASDMLGLTVRHLAQVDGKMDKSIAPATDAGEKADEEADQYAEYYAPLEGEAEEKNGKSSSIAGVDVPDSVPVPVIVGVAAVVVMFMVGVVAGLRYRQSRQQFAAQNANKGEIVIGSKDMDEAFGSADGAEKATA